MAEESTADNLINQFFYDGNICPNCKKAFKLVYANSQYYGCPECMSFLDISEKGKIKKITASPKKIPSSIPLGSKGEIEGIMYEVIGYTHCREVKTIYTWNEYYLYNKTHGFAYLSEANGHWIFLTEPTVHPKVNFKEKFIIHEEREFQLYGVYRSEVRYSEGEFDYDILARQRPVINEYIHPPYLLACEHEGQNISNWYQGEHMEASEIKKIFGLTSVPSKSGVGMVQVFSKGYKILTLWKVTFLGLAALLLIHLGILAVKPSGIVAFNQTYSLPDTAATIPPVVTPAFKLDKGLTGTDNLEVDLYAPVENTWLEIQISLINDETGEEFSFESGAEYYHGIDGGESWTEGDQSNSFTLSEIPAGTYHMNIFAVKENYKQVPYYRITLTRGVEMWSNLFIIAACVLVFPLFQYYRYNSMEKERWSNSDYGD